MSVLSRICNGDVADGELKVSDSVSLCLFSTTNLLKAMYSIYVDLCLRQIYFLACFASAFQQKVTDWRTQGSVH